MILLSMILPLSFQVLAVEETERMKTCQENKKMTDSSTEIAKACSAGSLIYSLRSLRSFAVVISLTLVEMLCKHDWIMKVRY